MTFILTKVIDCCYPRVQKVDIQGIEPWTSRMRSVRATTVPNALERLEATSYRSDRHLDIEPRKPTELQAFTYSMISLVKHYQHHTYHQQSTLMRKRCV